MINLAKLALNCLHELKYNKAVGWDLGKERRGKKAKGRDWRGRAGGKHTGG